MVIKRRNDVLVDVKKQMLISLLGFFNPGRPISGLGWLESNTYIYLMST